MCSTVSERYRSGGWRTSVTTSAVLSSIRVSRSPVGSVTTDLARTSVASPHVTKPMTYTVTPAPAGTSIAASISPRPNCAQAAPSEGEQNHVVWPMLVTLADRRAPTTSVGPVFVTVM